MNKQTHSSAAADDNSSQNSSGFHQHKRGDGFAYGRGGLKMHDISMDSSDSDQSPNLAARNSSHSSIASNMLRARGVSDLKGVKTIPQAALGGYNQKETQNRAQRQDQLMEYQPQQVKKQQQNDTNMKQGASKLISISSQKQNQMFAHSQPQSSPPVQNHNILSKDSQRDQKSNKGNMKADHSAQLGQSNQSMSLKSSSQALNNEHQNGMKSSKLRNSNLNQVNQGAVSSEYLDEREGLNTKQQKHQAQVNYKQNSQLQSHSLQREQADSKEQMQSSHRPSGSRSGNIFSSRGNGSAAKSRGQSHLPGGRPQNENEELKRDHKFPEKSSQIYGNSEMQSQQNAPGEQPSKRGVNIFTRKRKDQSAPPQSQPLMKDSPQSISGAMPNVLNGKQQLPAKNELIYPSQNLQSKNSEHQQLNFDRLRRQDQPSSAEKKGIQSNERANQKVLVSQNQIQKQIEDILKSPDRLHQQRQKDNQKPITAISNPYQEQQNMQADRRESRTSIQQPLNSSIQGKGFRLHDLQGEDSEPLRIIDNRIRKDSLRSFASSQQESQSHFNSKAPHQISQSLLLSQSSLKPSAAKDQPDTIMKTQPKHKPLFGSSGSSAAMSSQNSKQVAPSTTVLKTISNPLQQSAPPASGHSSQASKSMLDQRPYQDLSKANLFDILGGQESVQHEGGNIPRRLSSSLKSYKDQREVKNSTSESHIIVKNTSNEYSQVQHQHHSYYQQHQFQQQSSLEDDNAYEDGDARYDRERISRSIRGADEMGGDDDEADEKRKTLSVRQGAQDSLDNSQKSQSVKARVQARVQEERIMTQNSRVSDLQSRAMDVSHQRQLRDSVRQDDLQDLSPLSENEDRSQQQHQHVQNSSKEANRENSRHQFLNQSLVSNQIASVSLNRVQSGNELKGILKNANSNSSYQSTSLRGIGFGGLIKESGTGGPGPQQQRTSSNMNTNESKGGSKQQQSFQDSLQSTLKNEGEMLALKSQKSDVTKKSVKSVKIEEKKEIPQSYMNILKKDAGFLNLRDDYPQADTEVLADYYIKSNFDIKKTITQLYSRLRLMPVDRESQSRENHTSDDEESSHSRRPHQDQQQQRRANYRDSEDGDSRSRSQSRDDGDSESQLEGTQSIQLDHSNKGIINRNSINQQLNLEQRGSIQSQQQPLQNQKLLTFYSQKSGGSAYSQGLTVAGKPIQNSLQNTILNAQQQRQEEANRAYLMAKEKLQNKLNQHGQRGGVRQQHKQGKRFGHNFSASNKSEQERNMYIRDESEVDDRSQEEDDEEDSQRRMDSEGSRDEARRSGDSEEEESERRDRRNEQHNEEYEMDDTSSDEDKGQRHQQHRGQAYHKSKESISRKMVNSNESQPYKAMGSVFDQLNSIRNMKIPSDTEYVLKSQDPAGSYKRKAEYSNNGFGSFGVMNNSLKDSDNHSQQSDVVDEDEEYKDDESYKQHHQHQHHRQKHNDMSNMREGEDLFYANPGQIHFERGTIESELPQKDHQRHKQRVLSPSDSPNQRQSHLNNHRHQTTTAGTNQRTVQSPNQNDSSFINGSADKQHMDKGEQQSREDFDSLEESKSGQRKLQRITKTDDSQSTSRPFGIRGNQSGDQKRQNTGCCGSVFRSGNNKHRAKEDKRNKSEAKEVNISFWRKFL